LIKFEEQSVAAQAKRLAAARDSYKIQNQNGIYFLTFTIID